MGHKKGRKFTFQLIRNLIFSSIILTSILTLVAYLQFHHSMQAYFDNDRGIVRKRIMEYFVGVDLIYKNFETSIEQEHRAVLSQVAAEYKDFGSKENISSFPLKQFLLPFGEKNIHLYVFDEHNFVRGATLNREDQIDFTQWPMLITLLNQVRGSGEFHSGRFAINLKNQSVEKYSFLPSEDSKYIFGISTKASQFSDEAGEWSFERLADQIVEDYDFVRSITLYDEKGVSLKRNDGGKAIRIVSENLPYLKEALEKQTVVEERVAHSKYEVFYEYIPIQSPDSIWSKNVIEVVFENKWFTAEFFRNMVWWIGIACLTTIIAILYLAFSSKKLLKPIETFKNAVIEISKGNYTVRTKIRSNNEFELLSDQFDHMVGTFEKVLKESVLRERQLAQTNLKVEQQNQEIMALYEQAEAVNNELESSLLKQKEGYFTTVRVLANSIDVKDYYTGGHCERVMKYSVALGEYLGLSEEKIDILRFGSILHDVGKIGIPEQVLNKQGKFTEEERRIIQTHPEVGFQITKDVEFLKNPSRIIHEHHERYDGTGYPQGLKDEEIYDLARIVSIVDAFDAMTSQRSYRTDKFSKRQALEEIERCKGTQFDPYYSEAFITMVMEQIDKNKAYTYA